jgi:tRNA threonylcarbamoyladenosine biosynthesis protein TsaB
MRLLTIETSTPTESIAVVDAGAVVHEERTEAGRGHAERLLAGVSALLERARLGLRDLDGIAVSIGPGRWSGLRVGLASAKGLAVATGLPLFPVPTLEALALSARDGARLVCPMLDARRAEVYAALFRLGAGRERLLDDTAGPPDALARTVRDLAAGDAILFVGSGAVAYAEDVSDVMGGQALFRSRPLPAPLPAALSAIAHELAAASPRGADLASIEPLYLRGI